MQLSRRPLVLVACLALAVALLVSMGPRVRGIGLNTLRLWAGTCAVALPLGTFVATVVVKTKSPGRRWLAALLVLAAVVPLSLQVGGWLAVSTAIGHWWPRDPTTPAPQWLAGWSGAITIHAAVGTAWVTALLLSALRGLDGTAEEEASTMAGRWQVLRRVTLPQLYEPLAAAALWLLVWCAGEMAVTDFFVIRTFAEEVYTTAAMGAFPSIGADFGTPLVGWARSGGLAAGGLLVATVAWLVGQILLARSAPLDGPTPRPPWIVPLGAGRYVGTLILLATTLAVVGVPVAGLVMRLGHTTTRTAAGIERGWSPASAQRELFASAVVHRRELTLSANLAVAVATVATLTALPIGWMLRSGGWLRGWLLALIALLTAFPGPVVGLAVIALLNQPADSPLRLLTWLYDQTYTAPLVAQWLRIAPLLTLLAAANLNRVTPGEIEYARIVGAGWWQRFVRLVLPVHYDTATMLWLVALVLSVGELGATVLVLPPGTPTATVRLFGLLHYGVDSRAAGLGLWLLLAAVLPAWGALAIAARHGAFKSQGGAA